MRTFGRAARIIALLLGFYLMCSLLIAALVVVDVLTIKAATDTPALSREAALAVLATIGAVIVVGRGVFVSTRVKAEDLPGVVVSRTDEPVLWQRVSDLAGAAGTRAPSEIRLVGDVNASVLEHAHLLGLLPGRRQMSIGIPLLLALPLPQFDAIVGHELGHYSGRDVRLGPLNARTRESVSTALRAVHASHAKVGKRRYRLPGHSVFVVLFTWYARLVFTSTYAASRRQELAADRFAAVMAGRANAAAALGELPVLDASFDFYLDRYVAPGLALGLLPAPADVLGGFAGFVSDPRRVDEMAALRAKPREQETHQFDSHPPIGERVAAIMALPDDGRTLDESEVRSISLLRNPGATLAAVGIKMLGERAVGKTAASWPQIAAAVGGKARQDGARPLVEVVTAVLGRPARLVDLLDLVDAGRLAEVLDGLPSTEAAQRTKATGRVAREFAKTAAAGMLGDWAVLELVREGRASFRHDWSTVSSALDTVDGLTDALDTGIDALLAMTPGTAALRATLNQTGVPA